MVRSPCLSCRLCGEDKNNPDCLACGKRLEYLEWIEESGGFDIPIIGEISGNSKLGATMGKVDRNDQKGTEQNSSAASKSSPILQEAKESRLCKDCGKKEPLSPGGLYCASCMARRANEAKKAKKQASEARHNKTAATGKGKAESGSMCRISSPVSIDFSNYPAMYNELKALAEEELRSVEWQILYMLRDSLRAREECQS